MSEFKWPCDRRVAHKPHGNCPGVKAHPNTMIGKACRCPKIPGVDPYGLAANA